MPAGRPAERDLPGHGRLQNAFTLLSIEASQVQCSGPVDLHWIFSIINKLHQTEMSSTKV